MHPPLLQALPQILSQLEACLHADCSGARLYHRSTRNLYQPFLLVTPNRVLCVRPHD